MYARSWRRPWRASRALAVRWLLPALCLATVACAAAGGSSATPGMAPIGVTGVRSLLSADEIRWHARLLGMTDARRPDTLFIDSALASRSAHVRRVATLAIGQVGATARSGRLAALLADADTAVAANAAFALGLLRDSAAVPALHRALRAPANVALEAAWALGEIGSPARGAIEEGLADGAVVTHLPELLRAAAKLRPVPVSAVAPHLGAPDSIRAAAVYALSRWRPPAAVRHLLGVAAESLRDSARTGAGPVVPPSVEVLAGAARGLVAASAGDSLREPALEMLARLVRHAHPHVRINTIRSLATFGEPGREAIVAASRDPDANVRITAAQSVGAVLDSVSPAWAALWAADTGHAFRASLLASAAQAGPSSLVIRLGASWSRAGDWRRHAAYAGALSSAQADAGRDSALASLRSSADPRVRAATMDALADSLAPPAARERLLEIATQDPDAYVRGAALSALGARVTSAEVPRILGALERAQRDTVNEARLSAITAIAAAWRRDSAAMSPQLRERLRSLPAPHDAIERGVGRAASVLAHWPGPEGTARPLAWYEHRVRTYIEPTLAGRPTVAELETERGTVVIDLAGADAPLTVGNFVILVRTGYYQGTRFHRVVPNFVAQDGDPRGDGNGGPGYAIRDELNRRRYARGALGMALSGPHTGGSQFFLTHSPQPHLDGHYTVFGEVLSGWSVLDAIVQGDEIRRIIVRGVPVE